MVGVRVPQRVVDDLNLIPSPPRLKARIGCACPSRKRSEIRPSSSRCNALPVWDREINRCERVKCQAGEIEAKPPVQDIVICQIAKIPEAVGA